ADARGADLGAGQAQLVRDALGAMSGEAERVIEDLLLDLGADPIGVRVARAALLLDQSGDAVDLEGMAHLVEGVAVVAHDLAGFGDIAELLGKLQQRHLPLGTLRERSHSGTPGTLVVWRLPMYPGDPGGCARRAEPNGPAASAQPSVGKMRNQLSRRACVNTPGTGSTPAPVVAPPDLHETLGQFSEALCLAETTWRAFEAAEDRGEIATAGV